MVKFCPTCKKIYPISTTVCPSCHGTNLMRFCQDCKKMLPPGAVSCPICGDSDSKGPSSRSESMVQHFPREAEEPIMAQVATPRDGGSYMGLSIISVISFLMSGFCIYQGFDKMMNYRNSDYGKSVNAYVGGDAYNYIINGNYATGFFVLALLCVVVGFGCLILRQLKINGDRLGE